MRRFCSQLFCYVFLGLSVVTGNAAGEKVLKPSANDIEPVWAGHSVGFCLVTQKDRQFAAYYDANRQMTVAQRTLDSKSWIFKKLPSSVVWDSHNYVTMAFDDDGYLHVSGNMHCVPLIYFRASKPYDVTSLEQVTNMVDSAVEKRVTYPVFFRGPAGEFVFRYRDGSSGKGNDIYNIYDLKNRAWRHLIDTPLTDGRGKMNAYFAPPKPGPDGYFHLWGVWRNTPDCSSNHHLSYARSRDLIHWEKGNGQPVQTPITIENVDVVDPVLPGGGLLNGCSALGFDSKKRPVISYHKYDAAGGSQVFCARLEEGAWRIYQTTDWKDYKFEFSGGGSLPAFDVGMGPLTLESDGALTMSTSSRKESGNWVVDEATLKPTGPAPRKPVSKYPPECGKVVSSFPGMKKRQCASQGDGPVPHVRYVLCWETLPANRDRPRDGKLPDPSMLKLCTIIDP